MRFILLATFLLSSIANAEFDCRDIFGKWTGNRYEYDGDFFRENLSEYLPDGTWSLEVLAHKDGIESSSVHIESGTWACDGDRFITKVDRINGESSEIVHQYVIKELTHDSFYFQAVNVSCENVISDCSNTEYEIFRR